MLKLNHKLSKIKLKIKYQNVKLQIKNQNYRKIIEIDRNLWKFIEISCKIDLEDKSKIQSISIYFSVNR